MIPSADVKFNYDILPAEKATSARAAAERIKVRMTKAAQDIIDVGRELAEQKTMLGHGNFLLWLESEFEMSERTAYNFMSVHEKFGSKVATVASLTPKALYALAAPSASPIRQEVLDRVSAGEKFTAKDIDALKKKLSKAESAATRAEESALLMEGRAQTIERQLEGANLSRLYAEQEKSQLAEQLVVANEEIERLREPGVIHQFVAPRTLPVSESHTFDDDDFQAAALHALWERANESGRQKFLGLIGLAGSAEHAA